MQASGVVVRPYEERDREAVRDVCYLTGYMGEPIEWQWPDRDSIADMFTGYYTDGEPESAFVVEVDGDVSGYLLGCLDSSRAWNPTRVALRHVVGRGLAFRPGTARMVWRTVRDAITDLVTRRITPAAHEFADPRWPAHLHIDLLPQARGVGAGRRLMELWFKRLQEHHVPGCYLQTAAENTSAIGFFEAMGFHRHGAPVLDPGGRTRSGARMHVQVMVSDPIGCDALVDGDEV